MSDTHRSTPDAPFDGPVTLDNCEREPIHIPGSIQPHGALIAFDAQGRLSHLSANAQALLGFHLALGRTMALADFGGNETVYRVIQQAIEDAAHEEVSPSSHEVSLGGRTLDLVVHAHDGLAVCEFELRTRSDDEVASFAQKAYRSMDSLRRQRSIEKLLDTAVAEVRAMTGFDRVMAYRFRHDDSGEVASEARRDDLDPYLGRRYPASDIPAQARRLYVISTLRLIADVNYVPVALLADGAHPQPLDLSHSVLRSVSPIHVEYLQNMGVGASMSVSIVIAGRLWGMIACHHMGALQVPYSIRMAADVIAQLIAASIQSLTAQSRESAMAHAALLRSEVASQIAQGRDAVDALYAEAAALREDLAADAVVVSLDGKHRSHEAVDGAWLHTLIGQLQERQQPLVHLPTAADLPEAPELPDARYCGVLGLCFDRERKGWLIALRREQIQTIRWGGQPDKEIKTGPLGPRLTPRGSFAEWRETVRDTAEPWSPMQQEIASLLTDAVSRAHSVRVLELDRMRSQLWAVLGHDLRNPLQSLSMAAQVLDRQGASGRMNTVIKHSTHRMQRLLSDLQDITRVQNGLGMQLNRATADLVQLVEQLAEEMKIAHPGIHITMQLPGSLSAKVDVSRYSQIIANLLSNAHHHGDGHIGVALAGDDTHAELTVTNPSPPIPDDVVAGLFDPFKRTSLGNSRNPGSMGLGLYIAQQVVVAHTGTLSYAAADGHVTFRVRVPLGL